MHRHLYRAALAAGLAALIGLGAGESTAQQSVKKKTGAVVEMAGQKSQTFEHWKALKGDKTNLFIFSLPKSLKADEKDIAELTVQEVKVSKDELIAASKKLFLPPAGYTIDEVTKITPLKADSGAVITAVYIRGSYTPESSKKLDNYLMLNALFETKDAKYQVRLVGPQGAVGIHQSDFYDWLKAFK